MKNKNFLFKILGSLLVGYLLFFYIRAYSKDIILKSILPCKVGYSLIVDGKPFFIKGVVYNPTPIGEGYNYDFFSDKAKPWLVDGKLMKEMGINCIRIYSVGKNLKKTKEFIKDMYENFGIYTIVSDWLGLWEKPFCNYADEEFRKKVKENVLNIVKELKDQNGVLMWVLGNENNYTFTGKISFWTSPQIEEIEEPFKQAVKRAEIYYSFIEELAKEIKEIDKVHPVALGNGENYFLDVASKICKSIDLLAIIVYRGERHGGIFDIVRNAFDKPILVSEFGSDSYNAYLDKEDQEIQAKFILSQWQDIYKNSTYSGNLEGNCIGGTLFEWTDEWWKHNENDDLGWGLHNKEAGWSQGAYYFDNKAKDSLNMNEEWFGIVAISEEKEANINKRIPKRAYYVLKDFFSNISLTKD